MIPLGEIVGKLRYERKLSQAKLAEKVGLKSSSTIAAYEQGTRLPSLATLIELSRVFRVSTDYLLGVSNEKADLLDVSGLTPRQIESLNLIIENYKECNESACGESEQ